MDVRINLLLPEILMARKQIRKQRYILLGMLALVGIIAVFLAVEIAVSGILALQTANVIAQKAAVEAEAGQYQQYVEIRDNYSRMSSILSNIEGNAFDYAKLMSDITDYLPPDIKMTSFAIALNAPAAATTGAAVAPASAPTAVLTLQLATVNMPGAADTLRQLAAMPGMSDVTLASSLTNPSDQFTITANYSMPAANNASNGKAGG